MSEYVDFHYMPLEGKITGEQVLKQTEDAINDLGNKVYNLDIDESRIDEAVEKSEQAIETADSALSAVTTDRAVWKNTVAEMKATDIDLGVTAATRGKMVFNDGNGAFYGVRSEKSGDVESDDTVFLNNGNVAERIQSMNIIAKGNNIIFVSNVAELIDSDALIGNVYGTTGYYAANDGGAGLYSIRTKTQSDVDDGGSIIFLDNGNVAELITDGTVNVKQFGAYGDGTHDDTQAIQNAFDSKCEVFIPKGRYKCSETVSAYNSVRMEDDAYLFSANALEYGILLNPINDSQLFGRTFIINYDSQSVVGTGIGIGCLKNCIFNLRVQNSKTVGVEAGYIQNGNNENSIRCWVRGNKNGGSDTGVKINCYDNVFTDITTIDVEKGVFVTNGMAIIKTLHSWLSAGDGVANYWDNSCAIYTDGLYTIKIDWLYQDNVRYGAYGLTLLCMINMLTENFSDYSGANSPKNFKMTGLVGSSYVTVNFFNEINKYVSWEGFDYKSVYGCNELLSTRYQSGSASLPFSDADNAPTIGKYYCPYTVTNTPYGVNGLLKSELIGNYVKQTWTRISDTTPTEYFRIRLLTSSTWTNWVQLA